jgi:hypothetical protein
LGSLVLGSLVLRSVGGRYRGGMRTKRPYRGPGENENARRALNEMPKNPPPFDSTGPMGMQPVAHDPREATPMLPMLRLAKAERKETKDETRQQSEVISVQEQLPNRAQAVRRARARITRRKSLRKQRDAQRG